MSSMAKAADQITSPSSEPQSLQAEIHAEKQSCHQPVLIALRLSQQDLPTDHRYKLQSRYGQHGRSRSHKVATGRISFTLAVGL